ncbi:hypothetical protein SISSUDRAFT_213218 [Sistotremastrum suecicum HHB10207 ss-3]|uniref:Uncharacterized protein n=1 Tax=Sistotremastrum suecicum HHB10207 ss-3 TaxID=1314776 RepID=A0A166A941_9AGAM|nr:hypothetical protein SISSUDRAFT_213218 [Sistotremastrum suecicum HHB10207 ss-3]
MCSNIVKHVYQMRHCSYTYCTPLMSSMSNSYEPLVLINLDLVESDRVGEVADSKVLSTLNCHGHEWSHRDRRVELTLAGHGGAAEKRRSLLLDGHGTETNREEEGPTRYFVSSPSEASRLVVILVPRFWPRYCAFQLANSGPTRSQPRSHLDTSL